MYGRIGKLLEEGYLMDFDRIREQYYEANEAARVLGMKRDLFNYHVKQRHIPRTVFPPRTHGFYKKTIIDSMAQHIELAILLDDSLDLEYRMATVNDVEAENKLAVLNFDVRANNPENRAARRRFIETNPLVTHHLYNQDQLVACINLVPIKHEAILEFREGKRGWLFSSDMIEQYEPGHPLECIIINFMTTTAAPHSKRERYAYWLLGYLAETLAEWGSRGIEIVTVYASAGTEAGQHIVETGGFQFIGEPVPGRKIYSLDVASSQLRMLRPYQEALAKYKQGKG
jgi:hypothetical protein